MAESTDLGTRTFLRLYARDPDVDPSPSSARATNYAILQSHVFLKGAQAGALLGPLATFARWRARPTSLQMLRGSVAWMGWTAVGATVMGVARVWKDEPFQIYDRAYRLNNNPFQNRVDRISLISFLIGATLSPFSLPSSIPLRTRILGGGVTGLAGGVLVHIISSALWKVDEAELGRVKKLRGEHKAKAEEEKKPGEQLV